MSKIQISKIPTIDQLRYHSLGKKRKKNISRESQKVYDNPIKINDLALEMHPEKIKMVVKNIIDENSQVKTIFLEKEKNLLPVYRGGDQIAIYLGKNKDYATQTYSISGNPLKKEYCITIPKEDTKVSNDLYEKTKIGDIIEVSEPFRNIFYNRVLDQKEVLFLVKGLSITTIYPIIIEVLEKKLVKNAILLWEKDQEEYVRIQKELNKLIQKNPHFQMIALDEKNTKKTKEALEKIDLNHKSIFVAGNPSFYKRVNTMLQDFELSSNQAHYELKKIKPSKLETKSYYMTVITKEEKKRISIHAQETILDSLLKSGIKVKSKCNIGTCGYCKSKLIKGKINTDQTYMRYADKQNHYIHPCVSYPLSNITIELPF
ncbi:MAG: iron-sulfur cluster-binding domain-containing protein [Bacilli bacterium]|nr:iron-sulfur cluster-binding domain-containing protein [Bacilli bacterium]